MKLPPICKGGEQPGLGLSRNCFVTSPWGQDFVAQAWWYTCKPAPGSGKVPRASRRDKGLNAINILEGEPSRLPTRDFILVAVIIHKTLHSRSWSSASSRDFEEHLLVWWRMRCHQSMSQWWLTANCWVFAECRSPFWLVAPSLGAEARPYWGRYSRETF